MDYHAIIQIIFVVVTVIDMMIISAKTASNKRLIQQLSDRQSYDHREDSNEFRRENYVVHERIDMIAKQLDRIESMVYKK